jgi:hypothetical protein
MPGTVDTNPPASEIVRNSWAHRVEVEYATGACAAQLAWWLLQIGASPDLVLAANRVVAEELDHAARSVEICELAGLRQARAIPREALTMARDPSAPLEHELVRGCLRVFCLGESYAVEMLRATRLRCKIPEVREVIDRLLADEVGHRAFGFDVLGWMLDNDANGELEGLIREEYPKLIDSMRATFGVEARAPIGEAEHAWGVLSREAYLEGLERLVSSVLPERFAAIGLRL